MLPLAGYAERLSVRPGQTLRFHVANATGAPVSAQVVRVRCADPNPAIGGVQVDPVPLVVTPLAEAAPQGVPIGSYGVLGPAGLLDGASDCTVALRMQPTLALPRRQVLLSMLDAQGRGFELALTPGLTLQATVGTVHGQVSVETTTALPLHAWTGLLLVVDAQRRTLTLTTRALAEPAALQTVSAPLPAAPALATAGRRLSLASASDTAAVDAFNGRLEQPVLWARALATADEAEALPSPGDASCLGHWDFAQQMHLRQVLDIGPHGHHGELVNTPTRAVRGSRWTGHEHCFRHAPDQYAAIHFHDDALDDCRWPATHAVTVPEGFKSDAYALWLEAGDAEENIPFFVVPPHGRATARIAVLVSTYTYTVYGNHARPEWMADPAWRAALVAQSRDWQAYAYNPGEHRDYGLSTYNHHADGSGISLASWRRPMLNLRVGYITYPYPDIRGSGLRHYPADSHLLMWLAHQGHEVDLITDDELHHEGQALLARYKVVLTGSHPEYHTAEMLDALQRYRDHGGRLVYLGGNGFYWKIALDPSCDGHIEVRRGEGGIRAWAAEPGEYHHQFDGQYGGLWRRNARPPQKLVGVGFTAQGNFVGSHYRIDPAARRNPKVSWIFDGVTADTVGGEGFSGRGAAGFELDRVDPRLGSPAGTVVVARSENHPPEAPWVLVPEEQLTHITTLPGQPHKALIRADMAWFELPAGGEVFSVGSITFCGALPVNGFDNEVSRILDNVVRRFSR
jgi:N,N-dimethylformamidase